MFLTHFFCQKKTQKNEKEKQIKNSVQCCGIKCLQNVLKMHYFDQPPSFKANFENLVEPFKACSEMPLTITTYFHFIKIATNKCETMIRLPKNKYKGKKCQGAISTIIIFQSIKTSICFFSFVLCVFFSFFWNKHVTDA